MVVRQAIASGEATGPPVPRTQVDGIQKIRLEAHFYVDGSAVQAEHRLAIHVEGAVQAGPLLLLHGVPLTGVQRTGNRPTVHKPYSICIIPVPGNKGLCRHALYRLSFAWRGLAGCLALVRHFVIRCPNALACHS